MAITSATTRQLSDGNSQGTVLGRATSDTIAFYGVAPVTQQSCATTGATLGTPGSAQTASTGGFGASTAALMTSTLALVNALQGDVANIYLALQKYGLVP